MHAAIIAGGLGTRALTMTGDAIPKALLPVAGVPIIFRQLRALRREGVTRVSVLAGHLGDGLKKALEPEAAALELALQVIVEPNPLGTAGCLTALDHPSEEILVVYGDMLFDLALAPLCEFHDKKNAHLTIVAHPNDHPRNSDLIVARDGFVQEILPRQQSRKRDYRNLVPAGIYLASPAFFGALAPSTRADMINDVLPRLIAAGVPIAAYNTPEYLRDVGSPKRHALAEHDLLGSRVEAFNRAHKRPAIFFDCDGVLNEEPGDPGVITPDDVRVISGAGLAVRRARDAGLLTVAITNRPQVAKGFLTFEGLDQILGRLEALLAEDGGVLDGVYVCPHHPDAGFPGEIPALKIRCECRKPQTLLLRRAVAELPIDQSGSVLIGDSLRDIGAARGMGIWAYGVRTGYGCRDGERYRREAGMPPTPDLMFETVSEAVEFCIGYHGLGEPILSALGPAWEGKREPLLVAVSGRSRTGKSAISHAVLRTLTEEGVRCLLVRLDDWILPLAERTAGITAEERNRVDTLPSIISALRAGKSITAPGYDVVMRQEGLPLTYDPAGKSVILLEGSYAAHRSIRSMLDLAVFVSVPTDLQRQRFHEFYRWKGLNGTAIDLLWRERTENEWPTVDAQRDDADLVVMPKATHR